MPESFLYMRGPFPFGPEFGIPDGLIRDAKILLSLQNHQVESVRDKLEAFRGFLGRATIEKLLASVIEDGKTCLAVARLIANIDRLLRASDQSVDELLSRIEQWLEDEENQQKGLLSKEEFEQLKQRMPLVGRRFPGLDRQAKAQRLSEATGLPLEKIDIICDLRPVFDKDRDRVEGMIPYTTLKIVCRGVGGLPVALEAVLSQQDVGQLAKASADAEKKLAKLRELMREKELPVPCVELTREEEKK